MITAVGIVVQKCQNGWILIPVKAVPLIILATSLKIEDKVDHLMKIIM